MEKVAVGDVQKCIFVYYNKALDSLGIYIASSKEDAIKNIYRETYDKVPGTFYEDAAKHGFPVNVFNSIDVWSWEEWQAEREFYVSERLLEISG